MLMYTWKRLRRMPLPAVGVLLFSLVLIVALRGLHISSEAQQLHYKETWRTLPVKISVTNLAGTRSDNLEAPGWVADVFVGGSGVGRGLSQYMKDPQIKSTHDIRNGDELGASSLVGLTSLQAEKNLVSENGGVSWFEGYDESVLLGDEAVCLAPENLTRDWDEETPGQQLYLYFNFAGRDVYGEEIQTEFEIYLTVVGRYSGGKSTLYCPYNVVDLVYRKLQQDRVVDSVSATLIDNDLLDELITQRDTWFAEPVPGGAKTEWGYLGFEHYPYALDINDELLINAAATLENSIMVNQICTLLIFILSAGAGFFIGFLMIRQRKQEISLMRTLGTGRLSIYTAYAAEQMLCVISGILIGGMSLGWKPMEQLLVFAGVYFIGLSAALVIFLRKNLLDTIKEDE